MEEKYKKLPDLQHQNQIHFKEVINVTTNKISPIEEFRKERGWSRAELARESGISYVTCNNLENGYTLQISERIRNKLISVGFHQDIGDQYRYWRTSLASDSRITIEVLPEDSEEEHLAQPHLPLSNQNQN